MGSLNGHYEPDKIVDFDDIKRGDIIYFCEGRHEYNYIREYIFLVTNTFIVDHKKCIRCYETDNFDEEILDFDNIIKCGRYFRLLKHIDV